MNVFDLSGKVAIVTGATRGIGIAECLAAAGAAVVVASRSQHDCDRVAAELLGRHPGSASFGARCDIADTASIRAYATGVTIPVDGGVVGLPPSPGIASPTFDATRRSSQ
jgi:NAD(P)-dependent dehydrogenase (short-subunit alcohol dehydrogenase family)